MEVRGQRQTRALYPQQRAPITHCPGGWVGPRVGVGGYREEKTSRPRRVSNPEPPSPQRITTATTLSASPGLTHDVTDVVLSPSIRLVPDDSFFNVLITAVQTNIAQIAHARKHDCACSCARKHTHHESRRRGLSMHIICGVNT